MAEFCNAAMFPKHCNKCIYRSSVGSYMICDYIGWTGRMRGCDPKDCTHYTDKKEKTNIDKMAGTSIASIASKTKFDEEEKAKLREIKDLERRQKQEMRLAAKAERRKLAEEERERRIQIATTTRDNMIAKYYEQGLEDTKIAEAVHCSTYTVYLWRLDHNKESWYDINSRALESKKIELYYQGLSDTQIAEAVGSSRDGISKWRRKRNLPIIHEEIKSGKKN